ncbi:MAG: right-handed parallel beta-helix repeat-containing protein [Clostridia bacterium]|nr:right-handed parallel beta-helix repeat-containing protein [Clostridia bacterium]
MIIKKFLGLLPVLLTAVCTAVSGAELSRSDIIYEGFEGSIGEFENSGAEVSYIDGVHGSAAQLSNNYKYNTIKLKSVKGINRKYKISYYVKGIDNYEGKQLKMVVMRTSLHKNSLGEEAMNPVSTTYHYLGACALTGEWQKVTAVLYDSNQSITDEVGNCVFYPVLYYTDENSGTDIPKGDAASYAIDEFTVEPFDIIEGGDFSGGYGNFTYYKNLVRSSIYSENGNNCLVMNCHNGTGASATEKSLYYYPNIEEGQNYRISFRARTAVGENTLRTIFSRVGGKFSAGTTTGTRYQNLRDVTLTSKWQTFSHDFTAPSETASGIAYRYPMLILRAVEAGTIYLDDIRIIKIGNDIFDIIPSGRAKAGEKIDIRFSDKAAGGAGYKWRIIDTGKKAVLQSGDCTEKKFSFTMPDAAGIAVGIRRINSDGGFSEERLLTIEKIENEEYAVSTLSDKQEIGAGYTDSVWTPDFEKIRAYIKLKNKSEYCRGYLAMYDKENRLIKIDTSPLSEGINEYELAADGGEYAKLFAFDSKYRPLMIPEILIRDRESEFIYVDFDTGKSTYRGTYAEPVKQISGAYNKISTREIADDKNVYIMVKASASPYTSAVNITSSSRSGHITYVGYGGKPEEKPVLTGGEKITGWEIYDEANNIYRAAVTSSNITNFRQLYINGNRGIRARSNSIPVMKAITGTGYEFYDTYMPLLSNAEEAEFVYHYKWTNPRCGIKSVTDKGQGVVSVDMDDYCWRLLVNKAHLVPTSGPAYIENAYELLDSPGEWYYNKNERYVYYIPRSFEDMSSAEVIAPARENLLTVKGSKSASIRNITFKNLEFAYSNWIYPDEFGYSDAQSGRIRDNGDKIPGAAAVVEYADNVNFKDCRFINLGMTALTCLEGITNCEISGNEFSNLAGSGMYVGNAADKTNVSQNILIENNYIHDIGLDYKSCVGIAPLWQRNMSVIHNEIFDVPYCGIHGGYGARSDSTDLNYNYNYIHRVLNDALFDGGAIYHTGATGGSDENPNYMKGNYLKEQMNDYGPLYPDNGASGWMMCDNVIDLSMVKPWRSGSVRWLLSNPSMGNRADNNYTTVDRVQINTGQLTDPDNDPGVTITNTHVYPDASWPEEALAIIGDAGLSEKYSALLAPRYQITKTPEETLRIQLGMTKTPKLYGEGGKGGIFSRSEIIYIENNSPELFEINGTDIKAKAVGCGSITVYTYSGNVLKKLNIPVEAYS